jgi:PAS domain-containing protein
MQNDLINNVKDIFQLDYPVAFWRFDRGLKHVLLNTADIADLWTQPAYPSIGKLIQWERLPVAQRKLWEERVLKVFQTGWQFMMEDHIAEGGRWFQSTYIPEFNADGNIIAVVVVSCDITALKEAMERSKESEVLISRAAAARLG